MNLCFTVATINYIKDSMLVRDSFLKHNKGWRFVILVADIICDRRIAEEISEYRKQGAEFLFFTELLPDCGYPAGEAAAAYGGFELAASLKSFGFRHFFNLGWDKALYIDSDMKFYNSVSEAWNMLENYDAIVTPHMMNPYPDDGKEQSNQVINSAGIINSGFVAIKNTPDGNRLVNFWMACVQNKDNAQRDGRIHDQPWTAWFPYLSDKVLILKDKGYNAAYWNLHERKISKKEGKWFADDRPLVFFHFSGINKKDPEKISKYQNRYSLSDFSDDLRELVYDYIDDIGSRSECISAKTPRFSAYLPNTDFPVSDSVALRLLSICRRDGYSHLSADIESELFIARKIADRMIRVKSGFCFDIAGCFDDECAKDFLFRFLSVGVFFSIIDLGGKDSSKISFLKHFYAERTYNPGIIVFLSEKSALSVLKERNILEGKSVKTAVLSDECNIKDADLKAVLEKFDRIIALSEKSLDRAERLARGKAVMIRYDESMKLSGGPSAPGYGFIDDMLGFLVSLDMKRHELDGNIFYVLSEKICSDVNSGNIEAAYKNLCGAYENLDAAYKRLESSLSYRIGRALTSPISFILGIFKKR